jgi:carboxypeptidase C (cathepsin A)
MLSTLSSKSMAQSAPNPGTGGNADHTAVEMKEVLADWAAPSVKEHEITTHHSVASAAGKIQYSATAGTITLRDTYGKPTGSAFYVAYTVDGADRHKRPITFLYNGGPGAASIWLHLGSFGPMRIATNDPEYVRPAPFEAFGPNPDTLLDKSDLVFIDAIGTGYSRPLGDTPGKYFWGVDQDADAFARFIVGYVTKNDRWQSPKFLFGESYGTMRSAVLAYQLQNRGVAVNGVVLLSSVLNYGISLAGYDRSYVSFIPSYAAVAWYYHRVSDPPAELGAFVRQAEDFAEGPYAAALSQGLMLDPQVRSHIAQQLSHFTGLSQQYILNANLRIDPSRFRKELLRDRALTLGSDDARYTTTDSDAAGDSPQSEATSKAIRDAYVSSFESYIRNDLGYKTDVPYLIFAYSLNDFKWDDEHKAPGASYSQSVADASIDLAAAMRMNPYLHVLALNGYYDLTTPFSNTEYDVRHMEIPLGLLRNIELTYYPSGHMAYLNPDARRAMHSDIAAFYARAIADAESGRPH